MDSTKLKLKKKVQTLECNAIKKKNETLTTGHNGFVVHLVLSVDFLKCPLPIANC